jgi:hypothetical protein
MGSPLQEIRVLLNYNDRLLALGGLTVGHVRSDLRRTLDFLNTSNVGPGHPGDEDVIELVPIMRAQLNGELDALARSRDEDLAAPEQWPRQSRAIEKTYAIVEHAFSAQALDAALAQERKAALDETLAGAGNAAKGLGEGLEGILTLVIVLVVVLVLSSYVRKS